jgi:sensor histidine kinase YesM
MKTPWYSKKWVTVVLHIAVWVLLFSLPFLLRPSINDNNAKKVNPDNSKFLTQYILNDLLFVIVFYLNALVYIPRFINRKKYWQFTVAQLITFIVFLTLGWLIFRSIIGGDKFNPRGHLLFNLFAFLFFMASSTAYQMIRDRAKADRLAKEKENENLKTELSFLRSQVSPHFMFNVLNNMVALARKQSDLLEPSLIKLSALMRYMLYEADETRVPLEKEAEYLRSYIDLQQLRFGKKVSVNVSLQQIDGAYEIEPMLLIPFVENAFKHGTGFIEDARIDVSLVVHKSVLYFTVKNKYNDSLQEVKDKSSGIGLANVKRRLNLLYNGRSSLDISKENNLFSVTLQLKLN